MPAGRDFDAFQARTSIHARGHDAERESGGALRPILLGDEAERAVHANHGRGGDATLVVTTRHAGQFQMGKTLVGGDLADKVAIGLPGEDGVIVAELPGEADLPDAAADQAYVIRRFDDQRIHETAVARDAGPVRAQQAPRLSGHQFPPPPTGGAPHLPPAEGRAAAGSREEVALDVPREVNGDVRAVGAKLEARVSGRNEDLVRSFAEGNQAKAGVDRVRRGGCSIHAEQLEKAAGAQTDTTDGDRYGTRRTGLSESGRAEEHQDTKESDRQDQRAL